MKENEIRKERKKRKERRNREEPSVNQVASIILRMHSL